VLWLCVAGLAHAGNDAQVVLAAIEADLQPIPAGEFQMGNPDAHFGDADERPAHAVDVRAFRMARHAVTFAQYDAYTDASGRPRADDAGYGRGRHPVIHVSWDDAQAFIRWLNGNGAHYRLPSEAEWEYAARAGTSSPFWWGRAAINGIANCEDCTATPPRQTLPTGSFRPNGFGLFDVAGNAAEWVEDCWNDSYRGAPMDGSAWTTGQCRQRGLRGGSFASRTNVIRSAARFRYDQDVRYYANGFRIARDLK